MKKLDPSDSHHLKAAEGWLELGNYLEANEELENISPQMRAHPVVLLTRCDIYVAAKKWEYVVTITETLVKEVPKVKEAWIYRSFALHKMERTQEAFDLLLPAVERFSDAYLIRYNLACYACQLGDLKKAFKWLKKAIDLSGKKHVKIMALDDPDLEPLWNQIGEI